VRPENVITHLLFVDDEPNVLSAMRRACRNDAILPALGRPKITAFESPYGALEFLRHNRVDVVVSDYRMPELNGAMLLRQVRTLQPDAARVIVSGFADFEGIIRAINDAAIFAFVAKPWSDAEIKRTIIEALAESKELAESRDRSEDGGVLLVA
jgi:response regulator RpfG family c-di-GMP phosphodiesterase